VRHRQGDLFRAVPAASQTRLVLWIVVATIQPVSSRFT
jgi:hypothetical protein